MWCERQHGEPHPRNVLKTDKRLRVVNPM